MIRIDEMEIRMPGNSKEAGNEMGRKIAELLAEEISAPTRNHHIPEIRVRVESPSTENETHKASRIADQIIKRINSETF